MRTKWLIYGKLWLEYCPECEEETKHRFLSEDDDLVICCECGCDHKPIEKKLPKEKIEFT